MYLMPAMNSIIPTDKQTDTQPFQMDFETELHTNPHRSITAVCCCLTHMASLVMKVCAYAQQQDGIPMSISV